MIRIITEQSASPVVYCGYVVKAGTRDESPEDSGMAHFIEHMAFKGTERRRACHIANGLERVGGDLNAFTNKQETVYYATVLREDFERAVDVLTDIVFHSTFPQHEIDREVEVICDEIDSYLDNPSELIFDDFESIVFEGSPLGRDILGSAERLRQYTTADARRFADKYYREDNVVFFCLGDVPETRVRRLVERQIARYPIVRPVLEIPDEMGKNVSNVPAETPFAPAASVIVRDKGTHQAHVMMGGRAFGGTDARRTPLMLLNNILGGPGMNSRLNVAVREKAGLVYSIDSYVSTYPDMGIWNIYFGCDVGDIDRCRRLVERELHRFCDTTLTPAQLSAAKRQLKGQVGISCEARESYALALGKTYAWYDRRRRVQDILDEIEAISADELRRLAEQIYDPAHLVTLIYR